MYLFMLPFIVDSGSSKSERISPTEPFTAKHKSDIRNSFPVRCWVGRTTHILQNEKVLETGCPESKSHRLANSLFSRYVENRNLKC